MGLPAGRGGEAQGSGRRSALCIEAGLEAGRHQAVAAHRQDLVHGDLGPRHRFTGDLPSTFPQAQTHPLF